MRTILSIFLAWVVGFAVSAMAAGTNYNWKGTAGGSWTTVANWTQAGYPQAGDDANFTGSVVQTVSINVGTQTVNNLSVVGSGIWTWSPVAGSVLNVTGTFTYDGTATNSQFAAPIFGNGALVVNNGRLMLGVGAALTNDFSSVIVNGGILTAGRSGIIANTNLFGAASTLVRVGALSGTNDATIEFGNAGGVGFTYPHAILIRTGSVGRATLRNYNASGGNYGARLGGGITLQKDVHLASDYYNGQDWWRLETGNFDVTGPITGTGNVYIDDINNVLLQGTNSYLGQTIVNANHAWLMSSANTSTGNITIARGCLYVNNDGAFGAAANTVTLGGPGTLGTLGMLTNGQNIVSCLRPITLAGNGGIIFGWKNTRPFLYGPITGAGKLIINHDREQNIPGAMYGANNYSGGTLVVDGCMLGGSNTAFGTGDIEIKVNGALALYRATNVAQGAKILVRRNPLMDACGQSGGDLGVFADFVPPIDTNSNGKLAINFSGSTNVNAWLANGSQPIGDGTMFLGSWNTATLSATGLAALVANDPTHTYKLGTSFSGELILDSSNTTVGALVDIGGQPYNVQIGRPNVGSIIQSTINSYDDQQFSGMLTVWPGVTARYRMYAGGSANCVGATNGNISLNGHKDDNAVWTTLWIKNDFAGSRTVRKNDLQVNGSVYLHLDCASPWTTTVQVATMTRNNRSTLAMRGVQGYFGDRERLTVTNGVPSINGMVAPWLWNERDGTFLDYGATGFVTNQWDGSVLASATEVSKIRMTVTEQIPSGGASVYALCIATNNCSILANGGAVLTNQSGGVLLLGTTPTNSFTIIEPPMEFGTNEAVVITRGAGAFHYFNGPLRGTGGLTKSGKGTLVLNADNTGLTGGITINQGSLQYTNWVHLGNNTITLNGGALQLRYAWSQNTSPMISNNIVLGPCGGVLGTDHISGYPRFYGSISGSGWVRMGLVYGGGLYGVSTYTGGTYVQGMGTLNLWTNDALGTGPLCVGVGAGSDMNNDCSVGVSHDRALNTNTFVELKTTSSRLRLKTASPRLGSVEGNGFIILGDTSLSTTATLGLDNRDAEYFGQIEQRVSGYPCRFVKDGSGTWTLWNLVTLSGGVTVSNGTLRVNNWVNTLAPVTVYPGATLDGIGRVGIVSNLGGTVKGRLVMQQLSMGSNSVLQVALNGPGAGQYDVVTVNGPLNLTGGALALTLGFKPTPGQTFTILNNTGGSISGQFASGQTVSGTYNGQAYGFRVTYDSGNNIVLTALSRGTVIGLY